MAMPRRAAVRTPSSAVYRRRTPWPTPSSSSNDRWPLLASAGYVPWAAFGDPLPDPGVLRALQDRNLLFELMTHPDQLGRRRPSSPASMTSIVVVEHTGWPRSTSDEERALWQDGIDALAGLGDNVVCKLSGLAMPLESMSVDAFAPWLEYAIDAFGVDRCMFASNFPVDCDVRHLRRAVRHVQRRDGRTRRRIPRKALCRATPSGSIAAN